MKILAIAAGIFLARNLLLPISADDYIYRFVWDFYTFVEYFREPIELHNTIHHEIWIPIASFRDIFDSQIEHYFHWGGRSVAHIIVQFFMWQGKIFFDFANTIVFITFVILILRLARSKNILWTLVGLWICLPQFVPTMLWLTGSCNYLWMTTLQLGFLLALESRSRFLIPLGILAGWSNEAGAISIFIVSLIYLRTKKDPIESREIFGMISLSIGLMLLMFAPGNSFRVQDSFPDGFHFSLEILLNHLANPFATLILHSLPLILLCLMNLKSRVKLFLFGGFIAPTAMLFSPEFPTRAAFISPVLFLIGALIALEDIKLFSVRLSFRIASIFCAWTLILSLYSDWEIHQQHSARKISEELPILHGLPRLEKFLGERIIVTEMLENDPTPSENHAYNRAMAKFYGLNKIRRLE